MTLKILSEKEVFSTLHEALPSDLMSPIVEMLHQQYQKHLRSNEFFSVTGQKGPQSFYLKTELMETEDKGTVFELYLMETRKCKWINGCPSTVLDFLGHALNTFFDEARDARLPIDFTPFQVENTDVYARQVYRDFALEREAELWLSKHKDD